MPLYEYRCRTCNHEFERLIRGVAPPEPCTQCGGLDLERLPSAFAVDSVATRQSSLASGRRAAAGQHREKAVADIEAMQHHHQH